MPRAYNNRGIAYGSKGDYDRAIADYNEAIRLDPKITPSPTTTAALAYNGKGDYDRAIADYNEAIRLDPKYAAAYNNRGNRLQQQGRLRPRHRRLQRGDPARSEIRRLPTTTAAIAYHGKGDYDRAIADYDEAIRLNPKYALRLQQPRRSPTIGKGDYDRAIADYNEAIRLDPKYASPTTTAATPTIKKATSTAPSPTTTRRSGSIRNYAAAYNNRGFAYKHKGDYDRAIADYNEAIRLDPKIRRRLRQPRRRLRHKGDYDRAIADSTRRSAHPLDRKSALAFVNRTLACGTRTTMSDRGLRRSGSILSHALLNRGDIPAPSVIRAMARVAPVTAKATTTAPSPTTPK